MFFKHSLWLKQCAAKTVHLKGMESLQPELQTRRQKLAFAEPALQRHYRLIVTHQHL
jgi:hypothetical protein